MRGRLMLFAAILAGAWGAAPAREPAVRLAALEPATPVHLVLMARLRDAEGAAAFARAVSQPGDPLYQHFLTPGQFADRFALSAAAYDGLAAWAEAHGLRVTERSLGRTMLAATGPAAAVEAAFGVRLDRYRAPDGTVFFAADREAIVPAAIADRLTSVIGLSDRVRLAPALRVARAHLVPGAPPQGTGPAGSGVGGAYGPADLRAAYTIPPPTTAAATETVALFAQGGFFRNAYETWRRYYGLPAPHVVSRLVNGVTTVTNCGVNIEALLDIGMIETANPNVARIIVYEDNADPYAVAVLSAMTAIANDNFARTASFSYGLDESMAGTAQVAAEGVLFTQLAAQGIAAFASAGDGGAYGRTGSGLHVPDLGSQPMVTSVGGTSLFTGPGAVRLNEITWNELPTYGGTGGGVSTDWSLPAYQLLGSSGSHSVAFMNGGSDTMRNVPDVSSVGDPLTGVSVYGGQRCYGWLQVGGTSVSAPLVAGMYSLLNNAYVGLGLGRIGFFNPLLYAVEKLTLNLPFGYEDGISYDILSGSNGDAAVYGIPGFNAGVSFDNATGWGSPESSALIYETLRNRQGGANGPAIVDHAHATATATTLTMNWRPAKGATGYVVWGLSYGLDLTTTNIVVTTQQTATLSNLVAATPYVVHIVAVNKAGSSELPGDFLFYTKRH